MMPPMRRVETPQEVSWGGLLIVLIGELDAEGLGETITKVVGSTGLQSLAVVHHTLDGVGSFCAIELFLIGLLTTGDGHSQHILTEVRIDVQHSFGEVLCLFCGGVDGMTLLPQKFSVTQEGTGGLLPAQHAAPLVILHGQITVRLQHICKMLTEQSLGGGTDRIALLQLVAATHSDPGALGSKAFHVILFLLQQALGDQKGHIHILNALLLELLVHNVLNIFPDSVAIGTVDEHTLNGRVVNQLCLLAHVGKPLCKVYLHIGDLFNLFIFCHFFHPLRFSKFRTLHFSISVKCFHPLAEEKMKIVKTLPRHFKSSCRIINSVIVFWPSVCYTETKTHTYGGFFHEIYPRNL